jgi:hypothetical protein
LAPFNVKLEAGHPGTAQNLIVPEGPPNLHAMPARKSLIGRRSAAAVVLVARYAANSSSSERATLAARRLPLCYFSGHSICGHDKQNDFC